MAKLLRIARSISWIARALTANRDPNPTLEGFSNALVPTVDIFGTERLGELKIETILGPLGGIEIVHQSGGIGSIVDDATTRHYLSAEVFHDDPVARLIRFGRIVPTSIGFPFAGFTDNVVKSAGFTIATRNVMFGPRQLMAATTNAMAAGSRMIMTVAWIEVPPGEYDVGIT